MTEVASRAWNWTAVPGKELRDGVVRQMIYGDRMMICRLTIAAGTALPAHRHPHEQITIVETGRVRYILGEEERVFGPGDVVLLPGEFWHGATVLDEDAVLIDIFSPIREDFLES